MLCVCVNSLTKVLCFEVQIQSNQFCHLLVSIRFLHVNIAPIVEGQVFSLILDSVINCIYASLIH